MAPKAAMKTAMKAAPKAPMKAVIKKAMKVKASSSSSLCQGPTKAEKSKMTKKALKNLGNFTLDDKVQKAMADNEGNPTAAAADLKASLTKLEHSKLWGQHRTFLNSHPEEAAKQQEESKANKGLACALWYIQNKGQKFINLTQKVGGQVAVKRTDEWMSEKQMIDRFGQTDFQSHLASGRVIWREDPITRGTWEYKDQHNITRECTTWKGKDLVRGQEQALDNDVDKMFEELYNQDLLPKYFVVCFSFSHMCNLNIFFIFDKPHCSNTSKTI